MQYLLIQLWDFLGWFFITFFILLLVILFFIFGHSVTTLFGLVDDVCEENVGIFLNFPQGANYNVEI